jgi:hypothetical protein
MKNYVPAAAKMIQIQLFMKSMHAAEGKEGNDPSETVCTCVFHQRIAADCAACLGRLLQTTFYFQADRPIELEPEPNVPTASYSRV